VPFSSSNTGIEQKGKEKATAAMLHLDYCIIGGGIVGLAVGAALAPFGSVAVLERNTRLIQETSSRNSCVVHSGLYYPADSLKTRLCTAGNANIWRLQKKYSSAVNAKRIGKWIGACDASEGDKLAELVTQMKERRIPYTVVPQNQAHREEPLVRMHTIVNSTSTGIIDVHTLADFYRGIVEASSCGYVLCGSNVTKVELPEKLQKLPGTRDGAATSIKLFVTNAPADGGSSSASDTYTIEVDKAVICAAGLHANTLWSRIWCDGVAVAQPTSHRLYACKGRYAGYRGKAPVSRLVYPCPLPNLVGLGVHSVVDVAGQVRFGPDAVYVDSFDDVSVARSPAEEVAFLGSQFKAVSRYMPCIERDKFFADFAGIRPKLAAPGEGFRDFLLEYVDHIVEGVVPVASDTKEASEMGAPGTTLTPVMKAVAADHCHQESDGAAVVWLNGIESPGLTASSAIGDYVASWLVGPKTFNQHLPPWRQP
jgi:2-hydroxyglutarate dehydrogenase